MPRLRFATAPLCSVFFLVSLSGASHFEKPPCRADEVQAEVQGLAGSVCAPKCKDSSYECAIDTPSGTTATTQCMLKDVDEGAYCGLLCQSDSQCPTGAVCRTVKQPEVGICIYPVSFTDWAHQGQTRKLMVGWPSGKSSANSQGFKIAKAYAALQSLKKKYSIEDGDADMLTVKEFLSALSSQSSKRSASSSSSSDPEKTELAKTWGAWRHDVSYLEENVESGLPGLQREVHDTVWNIEHIQHRNSASNLMRGIIWMIAIYLGVGSAVKYHQQGSRGIDMIPHLGFWMEYPSLVMDGVTYSKIILYGVLGMSHGGGGLSSGVRGYQEIGSQSRDTFSTFEPSKDVARGLGPL